MEAYNSSQEQSSPEEEESTFEVLNELPTDRLVDFIIENGETISNIERLMNTAAEVLDDRNTSVEKELEKRETNNETKT